MEPIEDFHMVAVKLEHDKTGAEHLHIARDDQNNVFRFALGVLPCFLDLYDGFGISKDVGSVQFEPGKSILIVVGK